MVEIKVNGQGWGTLFNSRIGIVRDFRGDFDKGDPWVCVGVRNLNGTAGSIYPFPGHCLTQIKSKRMTTK